MFIIIFHKSATERQNNELITKLHKLCGKQKAKMPETIMDKLFGLKKLQHRENKQTNKQQQQSAPCK